MTDRFVCSDASVGRDEGIVATASQVRAWLLVEVHGAWGIDAVTESHLGAHIPEGWKADLQRRASARSASGPLIARDHAIFFVVAVRPDAPKARCGRNGLPRRCPPRER